MRKIHKKSEVIREGYVKGLQKAQQIITEAIRSNKIRQGMSRTDVVKKSVAVIVNDADKVMLKVICTREEAILGDFFDPSYRYVTITKGENHSCSVVYMDGTKDNIHWWGMRGYRCSSDDVWKFCLGLAKELKNAFGIDIEERIAGPVSKRIVDRREKEKDSTSKTIYTLIHTIMDEEGVDFITAKQSLIGKIINTTKE